MKLRGATRKTIIEKCRLLHKTPTDLLYPAFLFEGREQKDVWEIFITLRSGLKPSFIKPFYFLSEEEAKRFMSEHPIGSEVDETLSPEKVVDYRALLEGLMEGGLLGVGSAGDEESSLAYDTLDEAGIYKGCGPLREDVLSFLGDVHIAALKERHGDDWKVVGAFEYCWLKLPHSSAAYLAASYQYHRYITMDDFSAGYFWRDLEGAAHNVEATALAARDMREKASKAGGEKSSDARLARRSAFLDAMEYVAARNPDVLKLGTKALAALALSQSAADNPGLWAQGKGQVDEYLGEIRRGEAGESMKDRFFALFPQKPPKRFQN